MKTMITVESGRFDSKHLTNLISSNPLYRALHNATYSHVSNVTHVAPGLSLADAFTMNGNLVWTYGPLTDALLAMLQDTDNESETYVYLTLAL